MFSHLNTYIELPADVAVINRGKIDVDCDADAETLTVIDRKSLSVVRNYKMVGNHILSILLPESYATTDTVILMIVDNDGEYNAAVIDGVSAELVNLR